MKPKKAYDIIIIGAGAIGLSTAYHLAKTKKKVLVLERFSLLNDRGSSAGESRQFRIQYNDKYLAQMVLDSIPYWEALQKKTKETLIDKVGCLWFGAPNVSSTEGGLEQAMQILDELKVPYEKLNVRQIEAQYHFKNLPDSYIGFFQKDGGIINMKATLQALFDEANSAGNIDFLEFTPATDIISNSDGSIAVFTDDKTYYSTEKLIITTGAYANDTLKYLGLSIDLSIWEMTSAYYKVADCAIKYPTWFVFQEPQATSLFYGFPEESWANPGYIRVCADIPDQVINDPAKRTNVPSPKTLGYVADWNKNHMTGVSDKPDFESTCMVALANNTKDELLIDFAPEWVHNHKNIVVYTAGWAGKFIPLLGKMLVDLALKGKTSYDMDNFKIQWPMVRGEYSKRFKTGKQDGLKLDVAIIGGGASGLYSGYRLLTGSDKKGKPLDLSVNIFECSNRIGGRLESIKLPGMNVTGELGGMRYMPEQQIVRALIENVFATEYGLESIDFPMGDPDHHLFYLRKQRYFANSFSQAQILDESFKTRYFVGPKFEGLSSDTIFTNIISEVLAADGESLEKIQASPHATKLWDEVKKKLKYRFDGPYKDMFVYQIGFWNLILDRSSQEVYDFLAEAGGYYSNTINWNAAEAFPYMVGDFANTGTVYRTIKGGYDQVLTCLASSFIQGGGAIWTKNRLETFDKNPDKGSPYKYILKMHNVESNSHWSVYAKDIILAMPRRSLELLDQENFFFNPDTAADLQNNIASVIIEPSFKVLLGFTSPWWEQTLGAQSGESITDLPMRQCYYFGVDPANSHSLFLGSYNDMDTVSFFKPLEEGNPFETKSTDLVKAGPHVGSESYEPASQVMVAEVMKQVREMHGPSIKIPEPYTSAFKDWTVDPYGGGYHAWKAYYKVWEVMPYMRQPLKNERVFIAGEAYSDQQGWIEGAFCVSEHIMREKYGLTCPPWLSLNYYLGW